ncbi:4-(cytidine 5'-diphospho)-2-C-methyl-D-erythritol kinase [Halomonas campisalis]|uniref:4-diphosphocytidyl-2-C-methyl-D-erythritol kinase n=1 Tax=Billgrantia campisalis TaxID=74661 RepID=A0ABS9P403_9GAMM|nr:4-(cytidine 5'-diphospho)-2-C-methyl-D-erythritol kinase [Halomonas campisalis]MCG6656518.1 4-(cytidine 5'-diphospho)-2-C-methyl-D-erythritol kinase [Halomonas campisalis]MDR5861704.1 4-(cytidine 5'-diphospho)-2-C-methyl-D-erythritol kinase [Halomonas campisalis]
MPDTRSDSLCETGSNTRADSLALPAPAKLNRMLHIVGRRPDGYHELQTLFQFLDHGDSLHLSPRPDGEIRLTPALAGLDAEDNLVVRAARLLQAETGCRRGADIHLTKRLPMGGGLGGGSSNAATALLGLDRLWRLDLGLDALAELGLRLGADVPVFVHGHAAWAEGIGEHLVPVELDTPWFLVVHPGIPVATPAVFGAAQLTRDTPPITMARALQGGAPSWRNDCEATVRSLYPQVAEALDWLGARAPTMLTGTGACIFAWTDTQAEAQRIAADLPGHFTAFTARGANLSPLHAALGR